MIACQVLAQGQKKKKYWAVAHTGHLTLLTQSCWGIANKDELVTSRASKQTLITTLMLFEHEATAVHMECAKTAFQREGRLPCVISLALIIPFNTLKVK